VGNVAHLSGKTAIRGWIAETQRQVLYFLYWSLEQRSLNNRRCTGFKGASLAL